MVDNRVDAPVDSLSAEFGNFAEYGRVQERIEIPVNTGFVVVAAIGGVAVGLLAAYLFYLFSQPRPPSPPVQPTEGFTIVRDEQGRIVGVQGVR